MLVFLLGLVLFPVAAWAGDRPLIVLVTNHADAAIIPPLRSELASQGLEVQIVGKGEAEIIPRDLNRAARRLHAVAAIRVLVSEGVVELWIADRVTGKVVLREVLAENGESKFSETVVVLRTVELLRASLMEIEAPHPPRGEVTPPPGLATITRFGRDDRTQVGLEIGPMMLASVGGVSPLAGVGFDLGCRVARYFMVSGFGTVSLSPGRVQGGEGSADVSAELASLMFEVHKPTAGFEPFFRVGLGLLWLNARGQATPPFIGYERSDTSLAPLAAVGLRYAFGANLAVSGSLIGGTTLSPVVYEFENRTAATFGRFFAALTAQIAISAP